MGIQYSVFSTYSFWNLKRLFFLCEFASSAKKKLENGEIESFIKVWVLNDGRWKSEWCTVHEWNESFYLYAH